MVMDAFICITFDTQYAPTPAAQAACIICDEERQFERRRSRVLPQLAAAAK